MSAASDEERQSWIQEIDKQIAIVNSDVENIVIDEPGWM